MALAEFFPARLVYRSSERPFASSRISMTFAQLLGDHFPMRLGRRHAADKPYNLLSEFPLSLGGQNLASLPPSSLYRLPRLDQRLLSRLSADSAAEDLPVDFLHSCPSAPGFSAFLSSVYAVELG